MFNILTIDIEDYFQVHAFSDVIKFDDWGNYECRIERNTDRLLEILDEVRTQDSKLSTQNSQLNDSVRIPQQVKPKHCSTEAPKNNSELSTQNSKDLSDSSLWAMRSTPCESPKGTFFILGWIAERYPGLVRRIQKEGHEIACHGYAHKLIYTQSKEEFRQDIRKAKDILENITGSRVIGYRAPSYSITNKSQWAFEVLIEEGFKYDSSIFPIHHDFYGIPNAPRFPFVISFNGNDNFEFSMLNFELGTVAPQHSNTAAFSNSLTHPTMNQCPDVSEPQHGSTAAPNSIIEFPISTVKVFGQNVAISGGGYFRLFPYFLLKYALKSINKKENKPFIFYAHPWEFDPDQPRIKGAANLSKFRHYVNLNKTEFKFRNLLEDFQFSTIRQLLIQNS